VFDYGNNLRQVAFDSGVKDAFAFRFVSRRTCGRCSAAAWGRSLGGVVGDPEDIYRTDAKVRELLPR